MQNDHTHSLRKGIILVTYGILLYMGLQNLSSVRSLIGWAMAILQPVIYGIFIAFVINLALKFFREKVFRVMSASEKKWEQKLCPILCVFCTTLVALIFIAMVLFLIIPQVTTAINTLIVKMPSSQEQLFALAEQQLIAWHAPSYLIQKLSEINLDWDTIFSYLQNLLDGKVETLLGSAFSATASVLSTATNLLLGLIIAIYILAEKQRVLYISKKLIEVIMPKRYQQKTMQVLRLTVQSFSNFLTGQVMEALIIGTLCTIGMAVFRFPFAATIGVLTGITVLLPIIGAWIGGGIGALLIWVEAPDKVLWFLVFIFALQQLEGQFIYPKVVGGSIGLPGLLVLVAVIVGGGFAGITGIFFSIPLFSIAYTLLKNKIDSLDAQPESAADGTEIPCDTTPPAETIVQPETETPAPKPKPKRTKRKK